LGKINILKASISVTGRKRAKKLPQNVICSVSTPEMPVEPTVKNMVVEAGAEQCMGWFTCVVTTTCSVPPA